MASEYDLTPQRWTTRAISEDFSADLELFSESFELALQSFRQIAPDFR
jgi:hypothetical protein